MIIFFLLYQCAQLLILPLLPLYFLFRKFRKKPVVGNIVQRLGFVPRPKAQCGPVFWIHAVSVGEVISTQSLISLIKKQNPQAICYLTVGTLAGKKIAQEKISCDMISFLPYDFSLPTLLAFKRIKPAALIIIEAELWPNLLMFAHWKKIPLYSLNARMSKRSSPRYNKLKRFILPLLMLFEKIYTQSNDDKIAFEQLGIPAEKIISLGNIKAFNVWEKVDCKIIDPINPPALLVGSLHQGELECYLTLFANLKSKFPKLRLILAPRHFHWKDTLSKKVAETNFSYFVWENSEKKDDVLNTSVDIILVCKLGELFSLYPHAAIYFLGGTFVPVGGHNLLEPAAWGNAIIIGPHYQNCNDSAKQLLLHQALLIAKTQQELEQQTQELLNNPNQMQAMKKNARLWLEQEAINVQEKLNTFVQKLPR